MRVGTLVRWAMVAVDVALPFVFLGCQSDLAARSASLAVDAAGTDDSGAARSDGAARSLDVLREWMRSEVRLSNW